MGFGHRGVIDILHQSMVKLVLALRLTKAILN